MMVDTQLLRCKMAERNVNVADVAAQMGVDKATLYRRMADGETFTIGEVRNIKDILGLSLDEAVSMFFYRKCRIGANMKEVKRMADIDINASYRELSFADCEKLTAKRTALAEEVLEHFSDLGLTVATARDVLDRAGKLLDRMVSSSPVAQLQTRPTLQTDDRTI